MYTIETFKKGIDYLGITSREIMQSILENNWLNLKWLEEEKIRKQKIKEWQDRFKVPQGLTKKELNKLLKETQIQIDYFLVRSRAGSEIEKMWYEDSKNQWIEKKIRIKNTLKFHDNFGSQKLDLQKAKNYPIEQLLDFKAGKVHCLWHNEKTPSLSWDRRRNKVHCFAGCGDFDSIDVAQKLYNLSLSEAIKKLCHQI